MMILLIEGTHVSVENPLIDMHGSDLASLKFLQFYSIGKANEFTLSETHPDGTVIDAGS